MQTARSILPELASGRGTSRRSRMVEGQASLRLVDNPAKDRVRIFEDIGGRNTQCLDSSGPQALVPNVIPPGPVAARMRLPVHFDRQPRVGAEKIQHIGSGRMLASKLQAIRALSKPMPDDDLGQSHLATKLACAARGSRLRLWCDVFQHFPSTVLRTVPLPETSSGRIFTSSLLADASTRPRRQPAAPSCGCCGSGEVPGRRSRCRRPRHSP